MINFFFKIKNYFRPFSIYVNPKPQTSSRKILTLFFSLWSVAQNYFKLGRLGEMRQTTDILFRLTVFTSLFYCEPQKRCHEDTIDVRKCRLPTVISFQFVRYENGGNRIKPVDFYDFIIYIITFFEVRVFAQFLLWTVHDR